MSTENLNQNKKKPVEGKGKEKKELTPQEL